MAKKAAPAPKRKARAAAPATVAAGAKHPALLAAVLAQPDDIDARLVYADWLVEQGDPRGDFIHVQCALGRPLVNASGRAWARPTFAGDPKELEQRERKLLSLHQKAWVAPFRATVRTWSWWCGFVDRVVADCGAFLAGSEGLFAETPLVSVQLTAMKPPMLRTLADQPTSARLRTLDVNFQKLDAAAMEAMAAETWRELRSLNLAGNRLGAAGLRVLGQSRTLTSLRTLQLTDCKLADADVVPLLEAPLYRQLERLDLRWNALSPLTVHRIAEAGGSLVQLLLPRMECPPRDVLSLVEALPNLVELELGHTMEERVAAALATRRRPPPGASDASV